MSRRTPVAAACWAVASALAVALTRAHAQPAPAASPTFPRGAEDPGPDLRSLDHPREALIAELALLALARFPDPAAAERDTFVRRRLAEMPAELGGDARESRSGRRPATNPDPDPTENPDADHPGHPTPAERGR